jgi:hypothetical protein
VLGLFRVYLPAFRAKSPALQQVHLKKGAQKPNRAKIQLAVVMVTAIFFGGI